ncbi:hypothetical protein KUH03_07880 [Sphingobacterium sp. E70]|uniref:hypothetical protein n=1 Tax=Sphingobacterium sp. E70 TaxID=2853439 RepID=UPI00211B766B|nr:hypothetical protein [Sphingobacterium sp. E70]ULT26741.1 hypothetical protein KUH03_07880 [Sphingobacterium sp. E70]
MDALAYMQLKNEQIGRDFNSNYPVKMPNIFGETDFEAYRSGAKRHPIMSMPLLIKYRPSISTICPSMVVVRK